MMSMDEMAGEICPKCTSRNARYAVEDKDLVLRCLCGYLEFVYSEKGGGAILHVQTEAKMELPRQGTKLSKCLGLVAGQWPSNVKTVEVAELSGNNNGDTSTQLMVLMHKGLIEKVIDGKGISGGSTWRLTNRAIRHFNLSTR